MQRVRWHVQFPCGKRPRLDDASSSNHGLWGLPGLGYSVAIAPDGSLSIEFDQPPARQHSVGTKSCGLSFDDARSSGTKSSRRVTGFMMGSRKHFQKTVLVVEDMPLVRLDAVEIFENMGFNVLEAANGREALAILERTAFVALLFTDIEMPCLDGLELAAVVAERWPSIHIILTSGRVEPESGSLPDDARFLPKPYTAEAVAALML